MLQRLRQRKIPIEKVNVRAKKQRSIKNQIQNMCFKDPGLKYLGQKAFISYVKSVHIQKDKEVFSVKELPLEEFAASLGLPGAPRIKFVKGEDTKARKNASRQLATLSSDEDIGGDGVERAANNNTPKTKYDRMFERRNQDVLANHYTKLINDDGTNGGADISTADADEDDDFLSVKRRFDAGDEVFGSVDDAGSDVKGTAPSKAVKSVQIGGKEPLIIDSKRRERMLKSRKKLLKFKGKGTKLVYDDDGNPHEVYELEDEDQFRQRGAADDQRARFLEMEAERTRLADIRDKEIAKQKKREKKEKRRAREKANNESDDAEQLVLLTGPGGESGQDAPEKASSERELDIEEEQPSKKQKKGVTGSLDEEKRRSRKAKGQRSKGPTAVASDLATEVHTLEDLEALASGLLG
jgi:ATP-dependent RNA helicase DDX10/DBP4